MQFAFCYRWRAVGGLDSFLSGMKIIVEPIAGPPEHALSKEEIRTIWPLLPAAWTGRVTVIRLRNQLHGDVSYGKQLSICGRGKKRDPLIRDLITELYVHATMKRPTPFFKLSKSQREKIDIEIAPVLDTIASALRKELDWPFSHTIRKD